MIKKNKRDAVFQSVLQDPGPQNVHRKGIMGGAQRDLADHRKCGMFYKCLMYTVVSRLCLPQYITL